MKRKALGKGLSSLIPEVPEQRPAAASPSSSPPRSDGLQLIDIDRIWPNRSQPRERFDPQRLEELAQSLSSQGVLQPVIVRPAEGGTYELVAGERRWRAAQMAGLLKLPAVVREVSDDRLLELALIENLQREELNPLEEAGAYQTLMSEFDLSQQEVADRVGKQRASIANALRLLNLPPEVQEMIQNGAINAGHAKALASLTNAKQQIELAGRIARDGLSVRAAEALVRRPEKSRVRRVASGEPRDPNVVAAEEQLQSNLGTKVRIMQNRGGSGRLELHFYSPEELARIYQIVLRAARAK